MLILGKTAKTVKNNWNLVEGSEQMLSKAMAKKASVKVVKSDKFDKDTLLALVTIGDKYVTFKLDVTCSLEEGDVIDPSSVRVYQLTNGEKTITRLYGEKL